MKTKSIRIPKDMLTAIEIVEKEEKIEESTAMRKLIRIGFETYVGNLDASDVLTSMERFIPRTQDEAISGIDASLSPAMTIGDACKRKFVMTSGGACPTGKL